MPTAADEPEVVEPEVADPVVPEPVEPIAEVPLAPPNTPRPSIRKSPSKTMMVPTDLNALKKEINKPKEKEEESQEEEQQVDLRDSPFTPEDMEVAWQKFLDDGNFQSLDLEVLKNPYQLDGTNVTVSIPNEALVSSFEKFRGDLLHHLRNTLKNGNITLQSNVVEIAQEKMLYTDREKFEHLKNKYPALKDLQDKLGLDPEF